MNKLFSKIAALSVGLTMAIGVGVAVGSKEAKVAKADEETIDLTAQGFSNQQVVSTVTSGDFTLTFAKGSGSNDPKYYTSGSSVRTYANNTLTVSTSGSDDIVEIVFTLGGTTTAVPTASVGTYNGSSKTWEGESKTIVFTNASSGQYHYKGVKITTGSGDVLESITVTGSMSKTAYYVGESWSPAGLVATGHYQTAGNKDISDKVTWTYSPASPALKVTSVVATATLGTVSGNSSAQTVSVSKANPIQALYTKSSGASVDVYGYYVGFLNGTGPVIMDGAYGIVVYNITADVSDYTAGETILHVTGSISIFNGLYEIGSPSISVASGTFDEPDAPVVYAAKGGETAEYASRLTTVTGVPTVTKGSFDSDAGAADITMNFAVGTKTVQVFYKIAAQTADSEAFTAIKAAVAGSSEITIKGFTGWYNGFQVQMNGYVKPSESYTAEDFAQDLLDQTDAVCAGWEEGVNNHDALVTIWSNLASNDKYPSLPKDQKDILADAARDESGTVVEQAMARYDFLTGKYKLSNFINGRTPIDSDGMMYANDLTTTNSTMVVIVVIASISVLAFTTLLVFKKKKQK